jgi:FkbM family methyltransferase
LQLKRLILGPLILVRHGSLRPGAVTLPDSSHRVYLNPADDRAYKKLVMDSARGRISTPMHFWRDHVRALDPCLALDVGANYGEVFAFGDYAHSRCIAVEANPTLHPFLEKTRDHHPDASRIHLEACLVGDAEGGEGSLFFSPTWTGGGSAIPGGAHLREARVRRRSLDAIVAEQPGWQDSPLLLKMDVEGYEGHALAGFEDIFRRERVVGIMEFDTGMLKKAGTDPEVLFQKLAQRFSVYLTYPRQRRLGALRQWADLGATLDKGRGEFHCDLAFFSRPDLIAPHWTTR